MTDRVAMVELAHDVGPIVDRLRAADPDLTASKVIALSLEARLELKRLGIPHETTLPYFDNQSHAGALRRSEEMLLAIEPVPEATGAPDFVRAELSFCIRPLINYLLWLSELIASIYEAEKPRMLIGPAGGAPSGDRDWKVSVNDRPLGFLLTDFSSIRDIEVDLVPVAQERRISGDVESARVGSEAGSAGSASRLLGLAIRMLSSRAKTVLLTANSYGLATVVVSIPQARRDVRLVILDLVHSPSRRDLLRCLGAVARRALTGSDRDVPVSVPVLAFSHDRSEARRDAGRVLSGLAELADRIETDLADRFEHRGLGLASHIAVKLKGGIGSHIGEVAYMERPIQAAFSAMRPALVLSPYAADVHTLVGSVCRRMGVPGVMVTHGTHIPPKNDLEEIEQWRLSQGLMMAPTYEYTLAQSPWAARHADHFKMGRGALSTGPVLFSRTDPIRGEAFRQRLSVSADTRLVVYAVTQKKRSSVRFHVFENEDEYVEAMSDLVRAIEELEGYHLLIKLHPASELTDEDVRTLLPPTDKMSVHRTVPFGDVLSAADVLVSYSSTTIEEAILSRIPVVLFDRWRRYRHVDSLECDRIARDRWQPDVAYYVTNPSLLADVIEHAAHNAKMAAEGETLYARHLFIEGDHTSLPHAVTELIDLRR